MSKLNRRNFLKRAAAAAALPAIGAGCASSRCQCADFYPGWKRGEFDIHFIQTGCGEQTFFIFPDGTTMLLDCGDMYRNQYLQHVPRLPNAERLGGEWVSRYVQRLVPDRAIDYFVLTHWHEDHCGNPLLRAERSADGRLVCGVSRFAEDFDIRNYFDHQYPRAGVYMHRPENNVVISSMREWISHMKNKRGMKAHAFEVGAVNQIAMLRDRAAYPEFEIRNLFANAVYWDGGRGTVDYAPEYFRQRPDANGCIYENTLSLGLRFRYGDFTAYFGGDIDYPDHERRLAPIVGPVDVCKENHHGCPSSMGAPFCKAVRAQAYMSSTWSPNQVTDVNLVNMASRELYAGDRVILPGYMPEVKRIAYAGREFMRDMLLVHGHSVFKVAPGGKTFELFVLTNEDESMRVLHHRVMRSGANACA